MPSEFREKYLIMPLEYDIFMSIWFYAGKCSFKDVIEYFKKQKIKWYQHLDLIKQILCPLVKFVIDFAELYNLYHSDIKPDNIVLYNINLPNNCAKYIPKIIDLGGSSKHWTKYNALTPGYLDQSTFFYSTN